MQGVIDSARLQGQGEMREHMFKRGSSHSAKQILRVLQSKFFAELLGLYVQETRILQDLHLVGFDFLFVILEKKRKTQHISVEIIGSCFAEVQQPFFKKKT
jgi:hypothetical protein